MSARSDLSNVDWHVDQVGATMGRTLHKLKAVAVDGTKRKGLHSDGGGLYLKVVSHKNKSWVFRYTIDGKTRYAGLGSVCNVSLADAREEAQQCRRLVADGRDPIEVRRDQKAAARIAASKATTFKAFAEGYIDSHAAGWRNPKHRQQWRNTLLAYAYPVMGALPIGSVTTEHVLNVLRPMWSLKPETASRVRGRIEQILDAAKASGLRDGENPAVWRGRLKHFLPAKTKVRRVQHHAALPYQELPTFMARLRQETSVSAHALEYTILTVVRTNETLNMPFDEVDTVDKIWVIPSERMKREREHRVPLTSRSLAIINAMKAIRRNEYIFPGQKPGRPLSQTSMLMLLRRMGYGHITVHGFRSSFRDWAAETTSWPNHVVEMALAHAIDNKVEAAYRRGDLFEKRRKLMEKWTRFVGQHC
jgi:integrase